MGDDFYSGFTYMPMPNQTRKVTASQELLMKLALEANGNVNVQSFVRFGSIQTAFRIRCNKCGSTESIDDPSVLSKTYEFAPELIEFCKAHRHDGFSFQLVGARTSETETETPTHVGRMFRDED